MTNPNDNEASVEVTHANAGSPRRANDAVSFGISGETTEPTAEELDARQAAISEIRRSGPPLPEDSGPESLSFSVSTRSRGNGRNTSRRTA